MKTKILVFLIVIMFLVGLTGGCLKKIREPSEMPTPTPSGIVPELEPTISVPKEFQKDFEQRIQLYNQKISEWKVPQFHTMEFGSNVIAADLHLELKKRLALAQIDILADELKLDYIDFYPTLDVFNVNSSVSKQNLDAYDEVISKARKKGIKVHIVVGGGNIFTKGNPTKKFTWDEFKSWNLEVVRQTMNKYHPDAIFVIADPWYPWFPGREDFFYDIDKITPQMIADLAKEGAQLAKSIDSNVVVGVHLGAEFSDLLRPSYPYKNPTKLLLEEVVKIKEVKVIGAYPIGLSGLLNPSLPEFVKIAQDNGKEVWMTATSFNELRVFETSWAVQLSAKYITASVYWAQLHNYTSYSYGYTLEFISYDRDYLENLPKIINRRTITYKAYKEVIEKIRKSAKNTEI